MSRIIIIPTYSGNICKVPWGLTKNINEFQKLKKLQLQLQRLLIKKGLPPKRPILLHASEMAQPLNQLKILKRRPKWRVQQDRCECSPTTCMIESTPEAWAQEKGLPERFYTNLLVKLLFIIYVWL